MRTRRATTAQAIIDFLRVQHVERDGERHPFFAGIFGIFGHGNVAGLGEALETRQDVFRYHQARNEQGMVHAAVAFARQHRRLRAFACTTSVGPGATNLVTGAAVATVNRVPVLLLPGDVFASRRVTPVLQQLERPESQDVSVNDALAPVSRYWDRVDRPDQLVATLPAAMRVLTSPAETGAVTLALPQDVQAEAFDFPESLFEPRTHFIPRPRPDHVALRRAAELFREARRPMVVAGGGLRYSDAEGALASFAERFGLPVAETQAGKGSLAWDDPANVGAIGVTGGLAANRLARDADLLLAVGTRLADFTTASWTAWQHPGVRFIGLNIAELDAVKGTALPLLADARVGLEELAAALEALGWTGVGEERREEQRRLKAEWDAEVGRVRALSGADRPSQAEVIGAVNDAARAGDVIVAAAGSLPGDLHKLWRTSRPGGYHLEYGFSTMGYEIAGGLGAKMAHPESEVFVMVGDGSYLMLSSELVTSIQEDRKLTVVLVDNHGFRSIRNLSRRSGGENTFNDFLRRDPRSGRLSGPTLDIDFAANAASLGAISRRAGSRAELVSALEEARRADRSTVIVVDVDPDPAVPDYESWWDVPIAEVSDSPAVREARTDYELQRRRERPWW
ncbi:MAG: 3D-(3,5/4)-trihydroxycyclohexane-1,2-dione acylhydrolase (decyclizing) [Candidatus Limnocylindria bacterium]